MKLFLVCLAVTVGVAVGASLGGVHFPFQHCPVVDCFFRPAVCKVPLEISYIEINGYNCTGCPVCPKGFDFPLTDHGIEGRSLPEKIFSCPNVLCLQVPATCPAEKVHTSYIEFMGKKCQACQYCEH